MKEEFLEYKLSIMSIGDKIGQMIMIDYREVTEMSGDLELVLTKYNPGGFILFKSNIVNYEQLKSFICDVKMATDIKGMISVDQEGGRVQRLDERVGFDKYLPMSKFGETNDSSVAFEMGIKMGKELKGLGVDMNMAPVLDIFSNPENRVIADRAFGTNSEIVNKMAFSYAAGLKKENIMAVGKHFPGHGDTLRDSHIDLPVIDKDLEALKKLELIPFIEAVNKKLPGLMIGHLAVPRVTKNNEPASLSKVMISDLLRDDMGYDGVIMPDSLKMKALTNYFTTEDIYLRCVNAGNDILLMPKDIKEAYETIYRKVDEGIILESRINESVYKILSLKFDYGLLEQEYQKYLEYIDRGYIKRRCKILN